MRECSSTIASPGRNCPRARSCATCAAWRTPRDRAGRQHRPRRHACARRGARYEPDPVWARRRGRSSAAPTASPCTCARTAATSRTDDVRRLRELTPRQAEPRDGRDRRDGRRSPAHAARTWRCWCPRGARKSPPRAGWTSPAQEARLHATSSRGWRRAGIVRRRLHRRRPARRSRRRARGRRSASARSTPGPTPTPSTRAAATAESGRLAAELEQDPRAPATRSAGWACASTPGTRSTTHNVRAGRGAARHRASCTSATPSSAARSSSACARRCAR